MDCLEPPAMQPKARRVIKNQPLSRQLQEHGVHIRLRQLGGLLEEGARQTREVRAAHPALLPAFSTKVEVTIFQTEMVKMLM